MAELNSVPSEETQPDAPPESAPEVSPETPPDTEPEAPAGRPPLLAIVISVAALVLAVYIGTNVLGVLYAVVAPPSPPLPPNMSQVSHSSEAYGVDEWRYVSTDDACVLLQYVQAHGGNCILAPLACGDHHEVAPDLAVDNTIVARCSGQIAFSIFNEQWSNFITADSNGKGQMRLDREVYWIGTGPPS